MSDTRDAFPLVIRGSRIGARPAEFGALAFFFLLSFLCRRGPGVLQGGFCLSVRFLPFSFTLVLMPTDYLTHPLRMIFRSKPCTVLYGMNWLQDHNWISDLCVEPEDVARVDCEAVLRRSRCEWALPALRWYDRPEMRTAEDRTTL